MSVQRAEKVIKAIAKARDVEDDTLYCTHDVKSMLKQKMSAGIGNTRMVKNIKIHGLTVQEIPNPSNGRSVAIVCEEGEVFPLARDYK